MAKAQLMGSFYLPHQPVRKKFTRPGRTKQEFKNDCDVNQILQRFTRTGTVPGTFVRPQFLDCTSVPDLQQSLHIMKDAENAFLRLPATVRKHFDNNALEFVNFALNPDNVEQLREWGIAPKIAVKEPVEVKVINQPDKERSSEQ